MNITSRVETFVPQIEGLCLRGGLPCQSPARRRSVRKPASTMALVLLNGALRNYDQMLEILQRFFGLYLVPPIGCTCRFWNPRFPQFSLCFPRPGSICYQNRLSEFGRGSNQTHSQLPMVYRATWYQSDGCNHHNAKAGQQRLSRWFACSSREVQELADSVDYGSFLSWISHRWACRIWLYGYRSHGPRALL